MTRMSGILRSEGKRQPKRFFAGHRAVLISAAIGLLSGCATVGPDFHPPAAPDLTRYTRASLPSKVSAAAPGPAGGEQRLVAGMEIPTAWWQTFGSAKLNGLIGEALHRNPSLQAAEATLRQAERTYAAQAGSTLYPQVNANLSAQRIGANPARFGQPGNNSLIYNLYNASVGVSYNLDLFGGNRRALEALAAQADHQRYQLQAARLTLAANIVTAAFTQAQLAEQLAASEAILAAQRRQLEIAEQRLSLGAVARSDVLSLQTQVEQTRAAIPALRNRLEQTNHLLAVLAGQAPTVAEIPRFSLSDFTLPAELPLIVPSELVRRRPDIQAAEALLHAATAQYGVAVSTLFPQINLSASLGAQALTTRALFGPGAAIWNLTGQLAQPLFNGGLRAGTEAAQERLNAAAANYRQTVLEALRNVADVLQSLQNDAQILQAQAAADAAAQASLELIEQQYQLGAASYLQLLVAQQQALAARSNLIAARAQRLADTAALYQAMGGGFEPSTSASLSPPVAALMPGR